MWSCGNSHNTAGGSEGWHSHFGNQYGALAHTRTPSLHNSIPRCVPKENTCARSLYNNSSCLSILNVLFYICLILQKKRGFFLKGKKNGETKNPTVAVGMSKWEAMAHQWLHVRTASHVFTLYTWSCLALTSALTESLKKGPEAEHFAERRRMGGFRRQGGEPPAPPGAQTSRFPTISRHRGLLDFVF